MPLLNKVGGSSGAKVTYKNTPAGVTKVSKAITPLSVATRQFMAATIGNYALFAGGASSDFNGAAVNRVDTYNASLSRGNATPLTEVSIIGDGATLGNYAIFVLNYKGVDAYSTSLSKVNISSGFRQTGVYSRIAVNRSYALISAGYSPFENLEYVDALSTSLTVYTATPLAQPRYYVGAASVGGYAVFAGGDIQKASARSNVVDAYNSSLTRSNPTGLSIIRTPHKCSTSIGNYALFAGDADNYPNSGDSVEVYDSNLSRGTLLKLSSYMAAGSATSLPEFAILSGRRVVNAFDKSLTRYIPDEFSEMKIWNIAATIGNYALFAGGTTTNSNPLVDTDSVDAYTGQAGQYLNILIPVGCKYSFDGEAEKTVTGTPLQIDKYVQYGYIKYKNSTI